MFSYTHHKVIIMKIVEECVWPNNILYYLSLTYVFM